MLVGRIIRKLEGLVCREMAGSVRARLNAPYLWVKIPPSSKNQYKGDIAKEWPIYIHLMSKKKKKIKNTSRQCCGHGTVCFFGPPGSGSISTKYGSGSEPVPKCHGSGTLLRAGKKSPKYELVSRYSGIFWNEKFRVEVSSIIYGANILGIAQYLWCWSVFPWLPAYEAPPSPPAFAPSPPGPVVTNSSSPFS